MRLNKTFGIIIILAIIAASGYLLYPKKIHIGGGGLIQPRETYYSTQYKCLGFTRRTQQFPDFGGNLLCFGIRYNKQCFKTINSQSEQISCEEIPKSLPPPVNYGRGRKEGEMVTDTSTWKTYRNAEYGFEVRYPHEWSVHDRESMLDEWPPYFADEWSSYFTVDNFFYPIMVIWLRDAEYGGNEEKRVIVADKEAIVKGYFDNPCGGFAGNIPYKDEFLIILVSDCVGKCDPESLEPLDCRQVASEMILMKILSTFKFVE